MHTEVLDKHNCQRVKQLLNNANQMAQRQVKIAKRSTQFHKNLGSSNDCIRKQQNEFEKLTALVEHCRVNIDTLNEFVEQVQQHLVTAKQQNDILQSKLKAQTEELATEQRRKQGLLESMRTLKKATSTYINHKELPTRVQGVATMRGTNISGHANQWVPFSLAVDDSDCLGRLWKQLQECSPNASRWKELLCIKSPMEAAENIKIEKATEIIDLTSPISTDCPVYYYTN